MSLIKSGAIGKLRKVNIWSNFNYGLGTNPAMDSPEPEGVNYDMWLGPAPKSRLMLIIFMAHGDISGHMVEVYSLTGVFTL
jgi:hypothetical protein